MKIDRAFVEGLGVESSDESLVAAIIAMAGALGMTTIAEGVETTAQERASSPSDVGPRRDSGTPARSRRHKIPDTITRLAARRRARLRPVRDVYSA